MAAIVKPVITAVGGLDSIVSGLDGDNLVVGTAPANSKVSFYLGTKLLGTASAGSNGAFSYALTTANLSTLGQGTGKSITAKASDTAGNVSPESAAKTFEVKTVAPPAPTISNIGGSDGIVSSQTNDNLVVGTAAAGTKVIVYSGTTALGFATAGSNGAFSYALTAANLSTLGQGTGKRIMVKTADAAGNISVASAAKTFEVKTVAPPAPTISNIGGSDGIVSSQTNDNLVVGTAAAGTKVIVYSGTTALGFATAGSNGAFSYALTSANLSTLGQGTGKSIMAKTADTAGNVSGESEVKVFVVKTNPVQSDLNLVLTALNLANITTATRRGFSGTEGEWWTDPISQLSSFSYDKDSRVFNYVQNENNGVNGIYQDGGSGFISPDFSQYTPSKGFIFSSAYDDIVSGSPRYNSNHSELQYFTTNLDTFNLLKDSPSSYPVGTWDSEFIYLNVASVVDSAGNLTSTSSVKNFFYDDAVGRSYGNDFNHADLVRSVTLSYSALVSQWFSTNLWLAETSGIRSHLGDSTSDVYNEVQVATSNGIFFVDTFYSTADGESSIQEAVQDNSLLGKSFNGFDVTLHAVPKVSFFLGTCASDVQDLLTGTSANEVFIPLGGRDTITMGGGKDLLILASTEGNPIVMDFSVADDKIFLSNKTFLSLRQTSGALDPNNFAVGNPKDSDDFISYNQVSGGLFYDADGNGSRTAIQIATLGATIHPALTASSFIIG